MAIRRCLALATGIATLLLVGCAQLPRIEWPTEPEPEIEAPDQPELIPDPAADLPAPEGLRATSGEYREIPLQWDPLLRGDVGGYRIERAEERDGPYESAVVVWGRGAIAIADRGDGAPLGDGVTRFYRIRAFSRDGRLSEAVSEVVVGTTAPLPDPPQGLRAFSNQPREVPLSWTASKDPVAAGYAVERSPAPEGPFEPIAALSGRHTTSYVDTGLGDLRVLYYRVATRNPDGAAGPRSDVVRAVTKPEPLPPLGLRPAGQRLGRNEVAWEPNVEPDIAHYRLYRVGSDGERSEIAAVPGEVTTATDTGAQPGETARYAVTAVDRDGLESRPSETISMVSLPYALIGRAEEDGVHLEWDPRTDEGFATARVERLGWLGPRLLGTATDGRFLDDSVDLDPGDVYRYIVTLERPDASAAPPSQTLSVEIPEAP